MSAKRNPFQRRCKIDMVGVNLEVVWEMSVKLSPNTPDSDKFMLSLVVPMYNEEETCELFFQTVIPIIETTTHIFEIVCVNDGSSDNTLDLLLAARNRDPRIKIVNLSRNFGKDQALTAGLDFSSGEAIVPMDADLQDPPELIPEMIDKWLEGYDMVIAVRKDRASDSFLKRSSANLFYRLLKALGETPIPSNVGDFRLMDRRVVNALKKLPERSRFMKGLFAWLGFRQTTVYYSRAARASGYTKWSPLKLWNFALDGIFSFTTIPLRIWTYIGLALSIFSAAYILFIVSRTLILGVDLPGYASLVVIILFFSGMNMIGLGILGEYIGRIFTETKRRPHYIVRDEIGFDENDIVALNRKDSAVQ